MTRRKNFTFKTGHQHGDRTASGINSMILKGDGPIGTVLVREGEDVPLSPNAMIDLREEPKHEDGTPHFRTRKADPMRPFTHAERIMDASAVVESALKHIAPEDRVGALLTAAGPASPLASDTIFKSELERLGRPAASMRSPTPFESSLGTIEIAAPFSEKILQEIIKREQDAYYEGYSSVTASAEMPFSEEFMRTIPHILRRLGPEAKARFFDAINVKDFSGSLKVLREVLPVLEAKVDESKNKLHTLGAGKEILEMLAAPVLQRLGEAGFHKLIDAFRVGTVLFPISENGGLSIASATAKSWASITEANIFVVQHNWASAFRNADGFADGDFHLPFQGSVFEFRISGKRVILSIEAWEVEKTFRSSILFVETTLGWAMAFAKDMEERHVRTHGDEMIGRLHDFCMEQVRAVSISLEAEVAVTEVVRAPHKLNRKRERQGKMPIFDHHIVNLAHRKRIAPRVPEPGDIEDEPIRKRLHWVRAHWAHYTNHKVFRKWHLRGDPDLGFVDKEYRL